MAQILLISYALHQLFTCAAARVPGPKLWALSRLPYIYHTLNGTLRKRLHELHLEYGEVVRIAPNEVSFTGADAWKTIYAYRPGKGAFPKDPVWHPQRPGFRTNNISTSNTQDHTRIRKELQRGFAPQMMRSQEPVIQGNAQTLRQAIWKCSSGGNAINIVEWMHFVSYDTIAELGFGKSIFSCMENQKLHPALQGDMRGQMLSTCIRMIPPLESFLSLINAALRRKTSTMSPLAQFMGGAIQRRIDEEGTQSAPDFMSQLVIGKEANKLSEPEMRATAAIVQGGGGGTTASGLSAILNHLLRYPKTLERATAEIRSSFLDQEQMTLKALESLEYFNAVIYEGLRLCPPISCGVPRMVPPRGDFVSGYWLPGRTAVSVPMFAAHRSPILWTNPSSFAPERWLPPAADYNSLYADDYRSTFHVFSLGPRKCVGERIAWAILRINLATILMNFDLKITPGRMIEWEEQKSIPLWEPEPFYVYAKPRPAVRIDLSTFPSKHQT